MKKTITLFGITCLMLMLCSKSFSQEKHNVFVGYGVATHNSFVSFLSYIITLGSLDDLGHDFNGAIFAGYRYNVTPKIEVGGVFTYEHANGTFRDSDSEQRLKRSDYSLMADARFNYLSKEKFRLYSGASAGVGIININSKSEAVKNSEETEFAFHVDLIGLSYGRKIAPFLSFGYGYKGVINLGIQAKL